MVAEHRRPRGSCAPARGDDQRHPGHPRRDEIGDVVETGGELAEVPAATCSARSVAVGRLTRWRPMLARAATRSPRSSATATARPAAITPRIAGWT
jgi:hypothetical protein